MDSAEIQALKHKLQASCRAFSQTVLQKTGSAIWFHPPVRTHLPARMLFEQAAIRAGAVGLRSLPLDGAGRPAPCSQRRPATARRRAHALSGGVRAECWTKDGRLTKKGSVAMIRKTWQNAPAAAWRGMWQLVDAGIPGFARPVGANLSSGSREPKDRQNPLRERTAVRRRRSLLSHCGSLRQSAPFVCQSPQVLRTEHEAATLAFLCRSLRGGNARQTLGRGDPCVSLKWLPGQWSEPGGA